MTTQSTTPAGRRVLILRNPRAGSGRSRRHTRLLREALAVRHPEWAWSEPAGLEALYAEAEQAPENSIVVAAGGDGTVSSVVRGLARSGFRAALAILPVGTGNDFAFALGVTRDRTLQLIEAGDTRSVDLGWVSVDGGPEVPFANAVGVGFDAAASMTARSIRLPGGLRYAVAAIKTLPGWKSPVARFAVDDGPLASPSPVFLATIGNGSRSGGAFLLTPDARVDDGLLDLCVASDPGLVRAIGLMPSVLRGRHGASRHTRFERGREVRISLDHPVPVHADGEILSEGARDVRARIAPGALRVVA